MSTTNPFTCPYCGATHTSANGTGGDIACCGEVGHCAPALPVTTAPATLEAALRQVHELLWALQGPAGQAPARWNRNELVPTLTLARTALAGAGAAPHQRALARSLAVLEQLHDHPEQQQEIVAQGYFAHALVTTADALTVHKGGA